MSNAISLLTPQSCKPIRLGGAYGLSGIDVAHALATVRNGDELSHNMGHALINVKHNNDKFCRGSLQKLLFKRISDEAKKEKWKISKVTALVQLAVNEYCGNYIYQDNQRAALISVSPSCWSRVWRRKYKRLLDILEYTEQGIMAQLQKKLAD